MGHCAPLPPPWDPEFDMSALEDSELYCSCHRQTLKHDHFKQRWLCLTIFNILIRNFHQLSRIRVVFPQSVVFCGHAFKDARFNGICLTPHEVGVRGLCTLNEELISHMHPILDVLTLYTIVNCS